jgi:hypothetical protein
MVFYGVRPKFAILCVLFVSSGYAADPLPYSVRTRAYSGFGTTVRGDNETIGMAGATVAIPDSISSIESNPAGLTMTMGSVTAQINSNEMEDRTITGIGQRKVRSNQWGLTVTPGDWGYAIAYYTPNFEGGDYISANTGRTSAYEVSLKQVRFSVSHSMLHKRLSVGFSAEINHAIREIGDYGYGATDLSYKLGAIYNVKKHFLIGANFSPPQEIGGAILGSGTPDMPGFAQPVRSPMVFTTGIGWIPNRFFAAGFAILAVGSTRDTALLRDQSITVGEGFTFQPRIGASYIFGQYDHLKLSASGGSYYETSRIATEPNRLHFTTALQANPYFVNLGLGVDRATNYNNFFVSIGFDVVRALRTFDIIPKDSVSPYRGFFPPPLEVSSDGLPDPLTVGEAKRHSGPSVGDVSSIIQDIPTNIGNKFMGKPPVDSTTKKNEEVAPKKKSKHRRKKHPSGE